MEQQFGKMIATDHLDEKEHAGISWDDMPPEILVKIFPELKHQSLFFASLVNKKFNAIANVNLAEFKDIVEEAKNQDTDLLIASCKSSPKFTQAVIMSALEKKLSDEELVNIACTSLEHAEVILKSRLIYGIFKNENELTKKKDIDSKKAKSHEFLDTKKSDYGNFSDFTDAFNLLKLSLSNEFKIRYPKEILLQIAKNNIYFAKLVLKHALNALSGFNLMKIAEFSVDHAAAIFANTEALAKLKPGHMIGIAKNSHNHLKYILLKYPEKIDQIGIEQLIKVSEHYEKTIGICLISIISNIPVNFVVKHPKISGDILSLLAVDKFFTEKNPLWVRAKKEAPRITGTVEHAIKLYQGCFVSASLKKAIVFYLMQQSVKFAQVAFAHPNIHLILGQDLYDKVKNQLQNSLSEKQESESSLQKFTK